MTWHDAEDACQNGLPGESPWNGHLVSIHSKEENDFVHKLWTDYAGAVDAFNKDPVSGKNPLGLLYIGLNARHDSTEDFTRLGALHFHSRVLLLPFHDRI